MAALAIELTLELNVSRRTGILGHTEPSIDNRLVVQTTEDDTLVVNLVF